MKSKLYIARYGNKFLVDEDNDIGYIEVRAHALAYSVLSGLVSTTNVREHYDVEGVLRYVEYIVCLKG